MKCKKCGNRVTEKDSFCNRCGAKVDPADNAATRVLIVTLFSAILYGLLFTASAFAAVFMPILLIPIVVVGAGYAAILFRMFKKGIGYVPNKDNIKKCNRCGSQNIKLYRKGYDYRPGFWGALFGVRGAGYTGGFDANHTCCRCMDCGNDWETDYDYRLIDK